jgi:hypothetical protein
MFSDRLWEQLVCFGPEGFPYWFDLRPSGGYRLVLTYADRLSARGKAPRHRRRREVRFVEIVTVNGSCRPSISSLTTQSSPAR